MPIASDLCLSEDWVSQIHLTFRSCVRLWKLNVTWLMIKEYVRKYEFVMMLVKVCEALHFTSVVNYGQTALIL